MLFFAKEMHYEFILNFCIANFLYSTVVVTVSL